MSARFTLNAGDWTPMRPVRNERGPSGLFGHHFEINGSATFLRALSGDGTATPYAITDVSGLQGIS